MNNLLFIIILQLLNIVTTKNVTPKPSDVSIKKSLEEHQFQYTLSAINRSKTKSGPAKITDVKFEEPIKPIIVNKTKYVPVMIPPDLVQSWADKISEKLIFNEQRVVRKDVLLKSYTDVKYEVRNGTAIVEEAAKALEELLIKRGKAAEAIMRKAEQLATQRTEVPYRYTYDHSKDLDIIKAPVPTESKCELPSNCKNLHKMKLNRSKHFDGMVSLEATSVYVAAEVFDCDPRVTKDLYWSEGLLKTFRENYAQDSSLGFQFMCSAKGFLRHFPAASWKSMYQLSTEGEDVYDCRLRPWYVSASGAPRDMLILLDASGSMNGSSNAYIAEQFTLALLNALTDDDKVNVLGFNVDVESPVSCFNEKLVSANHVNSAAMMAALKHQKLVNETLMDRVLKYAVKLLQAQQGSPNRPPACQQAIVLVTDSLYDNYTQLLRELDPEGRIRLFVLWLHDPYGLRDNTRQLGQWLSCSRDGYFAELRFIKASDVTEQVINILRVLERPLVAQRTRRMKVYSDVYAHVEDPRRAEFYWHEKEKAEQAYRYGEFLKNKKQMLNDSQLYDNFMDMTNLETNGYYNEDENINYRLQVTISVPVFDSITVENITIKLDEEKQRNATRTYPVNRLLGVAGVDIPIDHLKLIFSYYRLGPGATLFLLDHRGNIVFHENVKPVFDGDVLKPGYRTVDFLDLEQPAGEHLPRHYPRDWLEFRKAVVIHESSGNRTMYSKQIFKDGLRATLEMREYYWKRVLDHYTMVVVLPMHSRKHAAPQAAFTQELAAAAWDTLNNTNFSVHPDWLYCRHVDHPQFESPEQEILYFIKRRQGESNFPMQKLRHVYSPIPPRLIDKTYQCNEKLMARICKDAVLTHHWMQDYEHAGKDSGLGSVIAFFTTESGLTRRRVYYSTLPDKDVPHWATWPRGPTESWYRRAAAGTTLLVHAPVAPIRVMRNSNVSPKPLDETYQWLTAARPLAHPGKGTIGVAGFHFHQRYMNDLLNAITNFPCEEVDKSKCQPRCDGKDWSCVVVDEGGWVVASGENQRDPQAPRQHLATRYPAAMAALLDVGVFKVNWIHDYQAVCFPNKATMPNVMISLWSTTILLMLATQELTTIFCLLGTSTLVSAETKKEREKRWNRVQRDFVRERNEREYERMMDPHMFVRHTHVAACDRSRALYVLQRTSTAMEALQQPVRPCAWPLTGAVVPDTNLLLLAIYNDCPQPTRPLTDPMVNNQVNLTDSEPPGEDSASRLACWRHRVQLPARPPPTPCFPHNYTFEAGYRQCGEWVPDPNQDEDGETHNERGYTLCGKWIPLPEENDGGDKLDVWFMLLIGTLILSVHC